jgi:hypothetical protein
MSPDATASITTAITISCETCAMRASHHCGECVVTFMCERDEGAVVLDLAEMRAVRLLAAAGLVPTLRHREAI